MLSIFTVKLFIEVISYRRLINAKRATTALSIKLTTTSACR